VIVPHPVLREPTRAEPGDPLTLRELDVIQAWMVHGRYKGVAAELGIAEQTVKNYAASILAKTGAETMGHVPLLLGLVTRP
jgi:DNA-binding CsgD family transcriptional regulator